MNTKVANNAVIAKARAVYGKFLTKNDYITLIHRPTIAAAVSFLKTKPLYAPAFGDTDETRIHREQAEYLINKTVFDNYIRICRFAVGSKNGIMRFHIRQLECEQLIKAVIAVSSGTQEGFLATFPEHIAEHLCYDPMKLAQAKSMTEIAETIKGTMYYRPLAPLMSVQDPDVNRIVTMINVCYVKWAFTQINETEHEKTRERLKDFFLRKIDADNLLMCYRMRSTFGLDAARINELLIPYHKRLRQCEIDEALKLADPVPKLRDMFISERIACTNASDIPEINVNISDFRFFRHRLAASTNETESLYSLMMLFGTESTNLCRIIEGIRYGLAPEEIEKYLII